MKGGGGVKVKFEVRYRDAAGRVCRVDVEGKRFSTPVFLPVYNPNRPLITPREFREEFKLEALMTNAYIIYRSRELKDYALSEGIHRLLGFDGVVFTDSGAYQMFRGKLEVSQEEIVRFQESIGSDVGVMLDVPSRHESWVEVYDSVLATARRAEEWMRVRSVEGIAWEGAVQGGGYVNLVELSCRYMSRYPFDLYAVGVPPTLWRSYRFTEIAFQGAAAARSLPRGRLRHAFGIGHPIVIPLLAALGYDIFDSASYALYAQDRRYITEYGTKKVERLRYLPCSCPVCRKITVEDLRDMEGEELEKILAKHNLYAIIREIDMVKQAVYEGRLWELVFARARSHPSLLEASVAVLEKYRGYFERFDPVVKRTGMLYTGCETLLRPDYRRASKRVEERLKSTVVPNPLKSVWPFGQHEAPLTLFNFDGGRYSDLEAVRLIADYQFGSGVGSKIFPGGVEVERSRRTGRIRRVWLKGELLATLRPRDGLLLLRMPAALKLCEAVPGRRYKVRVKPSREVEERVSSGRDVLGWHILEADPLIVPGEVVVVLNSRGNPIAVGEALLSGLEMGEILRGVAVKVRDAVGGSR